MENSKLFSNGERTTNEICKCYEFSIIKRIIADSFISRFIPVLKKKEITFKESNIRETGITDWILNLSKLDESLPVAFCARWIPKGPRLFIIDFEIFIDICIS